MSLHTDCRKEKCFIITYVTILLLIVILSFPVTAVIALVVNLFRVPKMAREMYPGLDAFMESIPEDTEEPEVHDEVEEDEQEDYIEEELPFQQLFRIGDHMSLLVDHVEMCPDETAFIRVVDEDGYTPLYKRKVRRDNDGDRYIVFNNENYYLNNDKTRPIVNRK